MVSEGSGSPQYPPGPARYQALWWNTEGITTVSGASRPQPDCPAGASQVLKIPSNPFKSFPDTENDSHELSSLLT